ncbi:MAG: elongation factor Ts [Actinobacteria bacterium]|nr:elongation factor Ts [Actinomycetota bacterium]NDE84129.1 elongation factor Ts [Actinomycetota bacterium]
MAYTAEDVKRLREVTAAGMLDCKKALDETGGDFDKAIEVIRVKGLKGVTKREGRATSNGLVTAKSDDKTAVLLELNCETDFVAKGDRFQAVAEELVAHLFAAKQSDLAAFLSSNLPSGKSVQAAIDEANATLGEKIELRRIAVIDGGANALYLHRTSPDLPPQVGVIVGMDKANGEVGKDVAQHIAAFAPKYLNRDEIPADVIANERRLAEETARNEGKPDAAIAKIVDGRVTGFVKEVALLEQAFAKDQKKSVQQVATEGGVAITKFYRFRVGQ